MRREEDKQMSNDELVIYLIRVVLLATLCGITEGKLLSRAGTTGEKIMLGHFSVYHIYLLFFMMLFGLTSYENNLTMTLYSTVLGLPGVIIIQDAFSHWTMSQIRGDVIYGRWAKWPMKKLWWGLPYFYWLLFSLQIFLVLLYYGLEELTR